MIKKSVVAQFLFTTFLMIFLVIFVMTLYLGVEKDLNNQANKKFVKSYFELGKSKNELLILTNVDPSKKYSNLSLYCGNKLLYSNIEDNFSVGIRHYKIALKLNNSCKDRINLVDISPYGKKLLYSGYVED